LEGADPLWFVHGRPLFSILFGRVDSMTQMLSLLLVSEGVQHHRISLKCFCFDVSAFAAEPWVPLDAKPYYPILARWFLFPRRPLCSGSVLAPCLSIKCHPFEEFSGKEFKPFAKTGRTVALFSDLFVLCCSSFAVRGKFPKINRSDVTFFGKNYRWRASTPGNPCSSP